MLKCCIVLMMIPFDEHTLSLSMFVLARDQKNMVSFNLPIYIGVAKVKFILLIEILLTQLLDNHYG